MNHRSESRFMLSSFLLVALSGCSLFNGGDFSASAKQTLTEKQQWSTSQHQAQQLSQLTDLIAIEDLTTLVELGIKNNPSLQQTAMALRIAYAQRDADSGTRFPQLSLGMNADRKEEAPTSYQANFSVSWELDLWQKLNDQVRASELDIAKSQANYQASIDALAANIMRSWLDITLQYKLINIELERLTVLERNEDVILERYRSGLGNLDDFDSASSSSARTKATLVDYNEQLARKKRTLYSLLGQHTVDIPLNSQSDFPTVLQTLASFPEQDLSRRPDLKSAYYAITAQEYRSKVAYKSLLPSINLSGSLSEIALSPSEALFISPVWSLLGQITAPLFKGGSLKAQAEIASLTVEKNYWAYQNTLFTAINEVENTLGQEHALERQQDYISEALFSAKRSAENYQEKYRQGLVDILNLLSVYQQTFDLQVQLTQITYNRLVNRIDLGLALGLGVQS